MALIDNIVAAFHFNESSGNAADSSANGNTLTNNGTVTYGSGKLSNAAYFDGSSGMYFSRANGSLTGLINTGDQSISLWAYFTNASPSSGTFFALVSLESTGAPAFNFGWGNEGGTLRFQYVTSSSGTNQTAARISWTPSANTWYHIVVTYTASGSGVEIFVNGSSIGTATASSTKSGDGAFQIGKSVGFGNTMNGRIDEVNIWTRKITSGEVTSLYNSGSGVAYPYATTYDQAVTATTSITGSLIKGMSKTLTVSPAVSGSVLKQMAKSITASVATTANMVKQMAKTLTGNVAVTASMVATKVYLETLEAIASVTASITKFPGKLLTGTATVTGAITKSLTLSRTLQATATITSSVTKGLSKALTVTVGVTSSITKIPGKILQATAAVSASIDKIQARVLTATASVTASIEAGRAVIMTATVATTATVEKTVGKLLAITLSIIAKISAPFYKEKYPAHGDGEDYEIKYPHE